MENTPEKSTTLDAKVNSPKKKIFQKGHPLNPAILFAIGLFLFFTIFPIIFFSAPLRFPNGGIINIEKGSSLREISLELKTKHLINSRLAFETFVIFYGGEKHIAYGDYLFENRLPVFEIARRIATKDRHLAPIKITIPEGYDRLQIADLFSQKLNSFNKEIFLEITQNKEGYLFPDTYFFFTNANEKDATKFLEDNFIRKIRSVDSEIIASGKSKKDIMVMASIIEREAKGDNDRGIISGILWNRIKKGMPLQVDAAPDTYKTKGLPSEPICNPGILAIKAAVHPVLSDYLYYLHDKNGQIHFAKTFTEHKNNKFKYLK